MRATFLALACAPALPACSYFTQLGGGPVMSAEGRSGRVGLEAQVHGGYGWGGVDAIVGLGGSARLRGTEDVQQLAGGPHLFATMLNDGPAPYLRLGAHVLQLERVDGDFGFGLFSPFVELGVNFFTALQGPLGFVGDGFSLGLWYGRDTRVTDQPSESMVGLTLGWAGGASVPEP